MGQIEVERSGAVMSIAINRPQKKNALTAEMYDALSDAVEQAETDPTVRVILLHGKGDAFTAGNDLEDFMRKPWKGQADRRRRCVLSVLWPVPGSPSLSRAIRCSSFLPILPTLSLFLIRCSTITDGKSISIRCTKRPRPSREL